MSRPFASGILAVALTLALIGGWLFHSERSPFSGSPIKVGVLHSLSGTMAISEAPVADATLLALDELNQRGGVLGRRLEPVVADGASDWPTFAREAERLIVEEEVSVVFGCWTSASRKMVKPIFEKYDHLLFYPVQYEGLETSPNIVYTGAAPNQQIIPAVKWASDNLGNRFFLVASDYVFPRAANAIIGDQVSALQGEIVGEEYIPLGSTKVRHAVQRIAETKPDVVLNTINGDTNVAFFRALKAAGIRASDTPTVSFSIAEATLQTIAPEIVAGHFAAWSYFQSIEGRANEQFVSRFRRRYGPHRVTSDPMEAAYFGVHLWAQTIETVGTNRVDSVREALGRQSLAAPEGVVSIDPDNHHTWKTVRIGKITRDREFEIVWTSERPIRPVPFPLSRTESEWGEFLVGLYQGWDGHWANPG